MFRLLTFGGLSLTSPGGSEIALRRSHLALLARIAVGGERGVRRDDLLAMFWAESDDVRARGSLKQAVYAIRRELTAPTLIIGSDDLRLDHDILSSDVGDFETLVRGGDLSRAAALYRGPFLHAVHIGNGEFSRWRDTESDRLAHRFHDAVVTLAHAAEARGDSTDALRLWRDLAFHDPLNASAALHVMGVLVRENERAGALKYGRGYVTRVRAELGIEPDAEILALIRDLERAPGAASVVAAVPALDAPIVTRGAEASSDSLTRGRRPASRRPMYALVSTVVLAGVAWFVASSPPRDDLLRITTSSVLSDVSVRERLVARLREQDSALILTASSFTRPRFLAVLGAVTLEDSLQIAIELTDRVRGRTDVVGPIVTHRGATRHAIEALAERLGVVLAARRNPVLESWSHAAAMPYSWKSYRALDAGIRSWSFPGVNEPIFQFDTSASFDMTSAVPLVWQSLVLTKHLRKAESDSVLRVVETTGRRQGAWDRAMIELLRAWNRGDLTTGHLAGHRLLEVVPHSEWAILPAYDAMALGREREALELFEIVRTDLSWTRWWTLIVRGQALHLVGDYATEARKAQEAFANEPDRSLARQHLVRAYAAQGRVADVEALCAESMQMAHPQGLPAQPCGQAMVELWAHGQLAAASRVADSYIEMVSSERMTDQTKALNRTWALVSAGRWKDAGAALATIAEPQSGDAEHVEYLEYQGMIQASRGERAAALRTRTRLAALRSEDPFFVGGLFALLGEKQDAVSWITRGLREGTRFRTQLHWYSPFGSLHGHAPFEELLKVRDDPEHRARYAQQDRNDSLAGRSLADLRRRW